MSKSNEVYDLIIDRLVSARYAFGERLLVKELSSETGASRQPIMSALNRLSAEGFVHIVPQVGCEVINPSRDEIADFFRLFQQIEGLLAELAAERRTEDDLMELKLSHQRLAMMEDAAEPSPERYLKLNQAFHRRLHEMAYSPLLARKQKNNFNMIDFFISQSVGFGLLMTGGDTVHEHAQIVDAIEKRDSARASEQSQEHIIAGADAVRAKLN